MKGYAKQVLDLDDSFLPSIAEVNAYLFVCQPWRLITFCGSLLWVVICTSRSASHMFFDYWRWCVRALSAHCIVLSEAGTQVKAHNRSPTHANELISSNMHQALPGPYSGRGVILQELWEQSFSIMSVLNEERPGGRGMSDPCQDSFCQFLTENFADRFWL